MSPSISFNHSSRHGPCYGERKFPLSTSILLLLVIRPLLFLIINYSINPLSILNLAIFLLVLLLASFNQRRSTVTPLAKI